MSMIFNGQEVHFTEVLQDSYRCTYCRNLLQEPMQTHCGHRFCEGCLKIGSHCPRDDKIFTQVFKDKKCLKEILLLKIYCPQKSQGCSCIMSLQELSTHADVCMYTMIDCPQKCNMVIARLDIEQHLKVACSHRPTSCSLCSSEIPNIFMNDHRLHCPKVTVTCPHRCGTVIERHLLQQHADSCPTRQMRCNFSLFGCDFTGTLSEIAEHDQRMVQDHMYLVTVHFAKEGLEAAELNTQVQEMGNEQDELAEELEKNSNKFMLLEQTAQVIQKSFHELQALVVNNSDRVDVLGYQLSQKIASQFPEIEQLQNGLKELKMSMKGLQQKLAQMERSQSECSKSVEEAKIEMKSELVKRVLCMDTTYNGKFIWKISQYSQKKLDAQTGRATSFYSRPFYTSYYGYKLCARVYLNGDGMGKDSHVSLFFVLMQGEYDCLLPWPFRQKVTLSLLDQSGEGKHLHESFIPDSESSSFQKPTSEMNVGSGHPHFVPQNKLEGTSPYVINDTILIKVQVDTTNLEN